MSRNIINKKTITATISLSPMVSIDTSYYAYQLNMDFEPDEMIVKTIKYTSAGGDTNDTIYIFLNITRDNEPICYTPLNDDVVLLNNIFLLKKPIPRQVIFNLFSLSVGAGAPFPIIYNALNNGVNVHLGYISVTLEFVEYK